MSVPEQQESEQVTQEQMFGEATQPPTPNKPQEPREIKKLGDIKSAKYNPRTITNWALEALQRSMMKFGDLSGITVNVRTGTLVGGHQRLKTFDKSWKVVKQTCIRDAVGTVAEGFIETPYGRWSYREVDWDLETEIAANIAANKHGGSFDQAKLKACVDRIRSGSQMDLALAGFTQDELSDMTREGETNDGKGLSLLNVTIGEPQTQVKHGDVYKIDGKHMLVVVDVLSDVRRWLPLLQSMPPDTLFLPYPGPYALVTDAAKRVPLFMIQPEPYVAGHLLDAYNAAGQNQIEQVGSGE